MDVSKLGRKLHGFSLSISRCNNGELGRREQAEVINIAVGGKKREAGKNLLELWGMAWSRCLGEKIWRGWHQNEGNWDQNEGIGTKMRVLGQK